MRTTSRHVANGPIGPVSLSHQCWCQDPKLPEPHALGHHPPGDPKRPRWTKP